MDDLPPYPDSNGPDTPRWVKAFGIIAAVVILLFVTLLLTRGPHRPGRHMPPDGRGGHTAPVQQP